MFGRREAGNQTLLVAIKSKDWVDQKGRKKSKAGFAKVVVANETKEEAQKFVNKEIEKKSTIHTDRGLSFIYLDNVKVEHRAVSGNKELLDNWLPWIHKFISTVCIYFINHPSEIRIKYQAQNHEQSSLRD